ncbi:hypothetical protein [Candidatus Pantoea multigeneris]|uniref:hypothetical protein n=1 Tax=Candidatus Pantoea multigeneris TaxID=2608357 RepID=UPI0014226CDA|nr:hypothetical protein [Pantoea multigeneris]
MLRRFKPQRRVYRAKPEPRKVRRHSLGLTLKRALKRCPDFLTIDKTTWQGGFIVSGSSDYDDKKGSQDDL